VDVSLLDMALSAAAIMADPMRVGFLALGVVVGLALGVIPGLGGLVGLSLLLPFTFNLDAYSAIAMLIGVGSVVTTSDTIPAVLFGVPGTVGSAATILDGHPMARRGEAGRAFGAAFMASMLGGLFGALLLGLSVPILRPVMLAIGTPELLSFCIFGLSLVAVLSGSNAFKGLAAACFGLLLATIGEDSQAGVMRWTFGSIYLWDGLHIVPLALGLFAIPELADLAIRRSSIAGEASSHRPKGQLAGVRDVFRHGFLVLRCSAIGSLLGSVPGIGSAVIDWIAYGHAARTEKGAGESFGKGDVRGVIASESSNNAKEGGALVPTIAFGVPGSASMALLLGAFAVHGIVPGPAMLSERLDVTYSMVWSVALANILGAGICFMFANQLARLALVRAGILVPIVLAVTYIGAFQGSNDWGDLYVLLGAGALGFIMKRLRWPRPPVILGFVLGAIVERYMFISVNLYGLQWMLRPVVLAVLLASFYGVLAPTIRRLISMRGGGSRRLSIAWRADVNVFDALLTAAFGVLFAAAIAISWGWPYGARLVPQVIAWTGIVATAILLFMQAFVKVEKPSAPAQATADDMHFDIVSDFRDLPQQAIIRRALAYFGWLAFFLGAAALVGLLPAMGLFLALYLRISAKETVVTTLLITGMVTTLSYLLFHWLLIVPWPQAVIGDLLPGLRSIRALRLF